MAGYLGTNLSMPNPITYFENPVTKTKVHILLDAAHMLKLCFNTLKDLKIWKLYMEYDS